MPTPLSQVPTMRTRSDATEVLRKIAAAINGVIRGQEQATRLLVAAFAMEGHILLEDVPGTGKTTLAKALARTVDAEFARIQFTPDLLPADILGTSVFNQRDQQFEFHKGPVFTNILLADEINRASPRTQSALLEAMGEVQVSLDGVRHDLDRPFFVIATQNPIEFHGTYPLPEAQMDRFALSFSLGYVDTEDEVAILSDQSLAHPLESVEPCVTKDDVRQLRAQVAEARVSDELKRYIVDIVSDTRVVEGIQVGASPRASLALMKCAQALAVYDGHDFVTPDLIQESAVPVISHRLTIHPQARFNGASAAQIVRDILNQRPVPN